MAELDDAYANAAHIPGAADFPPRWEAEAAAFRDSARGALAVPYGPSERAAYDLFLPETPPDGCLIFVHGGYWRSMHRHHWSHLAAGALARGWAVAMPSYDLCPDVRIAHITQQIAQAVTAIAGRVAGPISLAGHSAGGHLVARMLAPGMLGQMTASRIVACMPISPLADLEPLIRTTMNEDFQMDKAAAWAESPCHQPGPDVAVHIVVGGDERPAFLDQGRWLQAAWGCELDIQPDRHHFDVIEFLADPNDPRVRFLTPKAPG